MSLVTVGVFVVVVLVCVLLYARRFQKPKNSPPYEPGLVPYIGSGIAFGKSPVDFTTEMYKKVSKSIA